MSDLKIDKNLGIVLLAFGIGGYVKFSIAGIDTSLLALILGGILVLLLGGRK
jgi:hypothetical protein